MARLTNSTPARKPYKKKRVYRRRKPKTSFRNKVLSIVNKNRELKRLYFTVDEDVMSPTGSQFLSFQFPNSGNPTGVICNKVLQGSDAYQRTGQELTPKSFCFQGIMKYQGTSTSSGYDEIMVRVVAGFVDGDNAPLADADSELQLSNGSQVPILADYSAIMRRFNWKKFRPFYDKTTKLQPANIVLSTAVTTSSTGHNVNAPISRFINMKHYFGKNPKNMYYRDNSNSQASNIQILVIARSTNDDVLITANNLEISGEGHFAYHDV